MIGAAAAASLCAWLAARVGIPEALGLVFAMPAGLLAWWLLPLRKATLQWDGAQWLLDTTPVLPTVAMDLDRWLLLALRPAEGRGRCQWVPATARQAGTQWHALRAALYSRAPEAPLAAAASPRVSAPD